jgi:hypothetical protein
MALVRERTLPVERPPLVSEVGANIADKGCRVANAEDPSGRNLCFLDRSRYYFVPDRLILRKSGRAVNRTRTSGSVARNADH